MEDPTRKEENLEIGLGAVAGFIALEERSMDMMTEIPLGLGLMEDLVDLEDSTMGSTHVMGEVEIL